MNMIEKVARALIIELAKEDGHTGTVGVDVCLPDDLVLDYIDQKRTDMKMLAKAAIEAMRENTPAMSEAMRMANMNIAGGYDGPSGWEAAIDAALKEQ